MAIFAVKHDVVKSRSFVPTNSTGRGRKYYRNRSNLSRSRSTGINSRNGDAVGIGRILKIALPRRTPAWASSRFLELVEHAGPVKNRVACGWQQEVVNHRPLPWFEMPGNTLAAATLAAEIRSTDVRY